MTSRDTKCLLLEREDGRVSAPYDAITAEPVAVPAHRRQDIERNARHKRQESGQLPTFEARVQISQDRTFAIPIRPV
jgi:hypothetical protein